MSYKIAGKKMKRQGVRRKGMPKAHTKPGAKEIKAQAGQNYADIIKQAAAKKKKGKL